VDPDRDPGLAELRGRVSDGFRALAATKAALRSKVRGVANLKSQARRHPLWVLGLAAGTGLVGAYVMRQGRRKIAGRLLALLAGAAVRRLGRSFGGREGSRRRLRG
jgi:hypothetical protein